MTPLDRAHAEMDAAPADDAARLRFFAQLADAELVLMIESDGGGPVVPKLFDTEEGTFVLAFDGEDRLAAFAGGPAPYAALPGRALAAMLSGRAIGIGLNLEVAPSAILIPPEALAWLTDTLGIAPSEVVATPTEYLPPSGLPETLLKSLDARLAAAGGLAEAAWLVAVRYRGGRRGHLLAIVDARDGAEPAIARAVREALVFSDLAAGELDVTFLSPDAPALARLKRVGLRFDLPKVAPPEPPRAPGMDPNRPPKLR
jgi:hypothetical protein